MAPIRPNQSMLGSATVFLDMLEQVSNVAPLNRPVLVIGERGTGKELISARLHYLSPRWERPFLTLNCAALGESLLEAELFGHEAGAFTGATRRRDGFFERADGGTLFLDEIASASMAVQEKILRVVEYGEFQRLGSSTTIKVDVRLVAATNVDLPAEAASGRFRADLLDRLAFDVVTVPPLRERPGDIMLLARHFGLAMAQEMKLSVFPGFTQRAQRILETFSWPGNVRELKNVVERAVYRAGESDHPIDRIVLDPFESAFRPGSSPLNPRIPGSQAEAAPAAPSIPAPPAEPYDFFAHIAVIEQGALKVALVQFGGNQKRTAAHLGMAYHQLRNLLRKHGMFSGATANSPQSDDTIEDDEQSE
ncbi:MAG TPA: phage shock protein operon transcriptional activator [Alphaproteobacteria bacterium]|nr:phage shock protein operon transcriptional activator [Alphaproteobacteria bacterium]